MHVRANGSLRGSALIHFAMLSLRLRRSIGKFWNWDLPSLANCPLPIANSKLAYSTYRLSSRICPVIRVSHVFFLPDINFSQYPANGLLAFLLLICGTVFIQQLGISSCVLRQLVQKSGVFEVFEFPIHFAGLLPD